MEDGSILTYVVNALGQFLVLVLPPLGAALICGLAVGITQAATQIQDQTLPQTVKLLIVVAVLALFFPILTAPLVQGAKDVFTVFPAITARS